MSTGEKLLALTLEYRDAIENPVTLEQLGLSYNGRTPAEIGQEYEDVLRQISAGAAG